MIKCCLLLVIVLTAVLADTTLNDLFNEIYNSTDAKAQVDPNVIVSTSGGVALDTLDDLLKEIYGTGSTEPPIDSNIQPNIPDLNAVSSGIPGTEDACICVPYYLCNNNGTVNTNGHGLIDIRIQEEKCEHDLEICCLLPNVTSEAIATTPLIEKKIGCGYRNPDGVGFKITGNENNEARFGEFPWMVAVLHKDTLDINKLNVHRCGGALIHPQVVLTSAHCVGHKNTAFKIRAGDWDTQTTAETLIHQDRDVKTVIIHPQYLIGLYYNDVALLILEKPVELAENVDVVCLPPQGAVINNTRCFASGWGKDVFGENGKYQVILKKVNVPIVNRISCQEQLRTTRLGKFFELHSSFICAGGEPGKDTCKGDGGSPLVCPILGQANRFVQAGIVAWGIGCGEENIPGVYANVAGFRNWIDEQMNYNNFDTKSYHN